MIRNISIKNYKSVEKDGVKPWGRITVFIGANGSGKSNILEAIALASAAANDKLDNEFLFSRGIRVPDDPRLMRSAFDQENLSQNIEIEVESEQGKTQFSLKNDNQPYSTWSNQIDHGYNTRFPTLIREFLVKQSFKTDSEQEGRELMLRYLTSDSASKEKPTAKERAQIKPFIDAVLPNLVSLVQNSMEAEVLRFGFLRQFLIYSPEYTSLRSFQTEGQIQPLGVQGEGLFKLLQVLSTAKQKGKLSEIKERLSYLDWFADFEIPARRLSNEQTLRIRDRHLCPELAYFDQKSTNEGFLFLLFYFCLFISDKTPPFFAVDNIDSSLNPKLCSRLMEDLTELAAKHGKTGDFHHPQSRSFGRPQFARR